MNDEPSLGKIALFGAGGAVGHALAPILQRSGIAYRAVGRDRARLQREFPGADAVSADFLTSEGLAAAAGGIDTVFYLAGAPYNKFDQHPIMTRNALRAAAESGVKRFIHVAPVYSYGAQASQPVPESAPHAPATRKGRFRLEQEQLVLRADGPAMRTLILHLPDFYGPYADNSLANYFMKEATAGRPATFLGPLGVKREFVFVPDVGEPLVRLASVEDAYGKCWNLGGYATITGAELAALVFGVLERPQRVRAISKPLLAVAGLFDPTMRELVEMYYLVSGGFILDDSAIRARLGSIEKTPYSEGVRKTLDWMSAREPRGE